jgi:hypothetical protein
VGVAPADGASLAAGTAGGSALAIELIIAQALTTIGNRTREV